MNAGKIDVVSLGELLIDFTVNGKSEQGNFMFEANPGGAPCNVLAMLKKLGKKTAFIGKVGQDMFGNILKNTLDEIGIGTSSLMMDSEYNTTLAFVYTAEDGDRSFSFYRKPGADMMLTEEEIDEDLIKNAKIFHFGTLSMTDEGVRKATKKAIKCAKDHGLLISFDPNLRPPLWKSLDAAKEQILYGLSQCDILKISDEELEFITNCKEIEKGVKILEDNFNIQLIMVTMGKKGSMAFYNGMTARKETFNQIKAVDTTGAGDTFWGCTLNFVLEYGIDNLNESILNEILLFANAAATIVTTRKGAIRSMPEKDEVLKLISQYC